MRVTNEPNQPNNVEEDTKPIVEEDHVEEAESDDVYVGRTFGDENKSYDAYNSYALAKGFGI